MRRVLRTFAIPKWCYSILSVYRHTYELVFICYIVCACWMDKCGSIISRQQPLLLPQYFNAKSKNMAMDETVKSTYIYIHTYIQTYFYKWLRMCVCFENYKRYLNVCVCLRGSMEIFRVLKILIVCVYAPHHTHIYSHFDAKTGIKDKVR